VDASDGRYVLYRISKVIDVPQIDAEQRRALAKQLDPLLGQETLDARVASLRQNGDVKVNEKLLVERTGG